MKKAAPVGSGAGLEGHEKRANFTPDIANTQASVRALGVGLLLMPDPLAAAPIFSCHLHVQQNLWLAETSLNALPRDMTEMLASEARLWISAGRPIPPLFSYADEARDWTFFATLAERRAYLAAVWNRMPATERKSFLRAACKREATS